MRVLASMLAFAFASVTSARPCRRADSAAATAPRRRDPDHTRHSRDVETCSGLPSSRSRHRARSRRDSASSSGRRADWEDASSTSGATRSPWLLASLEPRGAGIGDQCLQLHRDRGRHAAPLGKHESRAQPGRMMVWYTVPDLERPQHEARGRHPLRRTSVHVDRQDVFRSTPSSGISSSRTFPRDRAAPHAGNPRALRVGMRGEGLPRPLLPRVYRADSLDKQLDYAVNALATPTPHLRWSPING